MRDFLTPEATKWQYTHGVGDQTAVAPESYTLDSALLARPGNEEVQLDLFLDYASNVALYPQFPSKAKPIFGLVLVIASASVLFGWDKQAEAAVVKRLPATWVDLLTKF